MRIPYYAEVLEDRTLLAVTAVFAVDTLTVTMDAANDAAFIGYDGTNIIVGTTDGGSDIYSGADDISNLVILDAGINADQQVTFGGSNIITSTGGGDLTTVTAQGIETANVNQLIEVTTITGDADVANVADPGLIQHGINLVAAGGTVNVAAGTYVEDLVFDATKTDLELAGAGSATTTIKGIATNPQTSFPLAAPNINILAAGVQIHGFTIESPDVPAGSYSSGIVIDSPDVEIFNNAFVSIQGDTPPTGANDSLTNVIIQTWAGSNSGKASDVDGLFIHDNTFTGDGKGYYGVFVNPQGEPVGITAADTVRIEDNTFTGNIWRAVEVERSNALIDGNVITPSAQTLHAWGGSGISVRDFGTATIDDVTISNNTILGADANLGQGFANGILLGFDTETLTDITVTGNVVSENETGIQVNTTADGITVFGNSLVDNLTAVDNDDAATLDASANWWGTTVAGAIDTLTEGLVDFTPFLGTGVDQNVGTPGFQGDFSTLNVTTLGEQVTPPERISEAVALVTDSGTINLNSGVYNDNLDATGKALTIAIGANVGQVSVNNLTLNTDDTLEIEVNGLITPGTDFDQIVVDGTVNLGGATLVTSGTVSGVKAGNEVVFIDNLGTDAVLGTFDSLANGAIVTINGERFQIFYDGGDGNDVVLVAAPLDIIVTAPGPGTDGIVRVFDAFNQDLLFLLEPYPGFLGGVRVAVGDVNGDGAPDIITAAGPGGGPHIKVFDGTDGTTLLKNFFAYNPAFTGGVFVAAADLNGDNMADIITGADSGGGPHVKVFSGFDGSEQFSFFAYEAGFPGQTGVFLGGVRVAAGDITGDGTPDIITGAGPGGGPHVRVFDGSIPQVGGVPGVDINQSSGHPLGSFFAYDIGFAGGVFVAAGDVSGDGRIDLITGAGTGGGPHVKVFDGSTGTQLAGPLGSFFAYNPAFTGGVRVAASDVNGDGRADIITGAGPGGGPHLRIFDAASTTTPVVIRDTFVEDPAFTGGIFVAGDVELESVSAPAIIAGGELDQLFADGDSLTELLD